LLPVDHTVEMEILRLFHAQVSSGFHSCPRRYTLVQVKRNHGVRRIFGGSILGWILEMCGQIFDLGES
jgi:hypothetical protein